MSGRAAGGWRHRLARGAGTWLAQHLQCAVASLGTLWRARLATVLTIGVIGVALALPLALFLVVQELRSVSTYFGSGFEISAFLHQEIDLTVIAIEIYRLTNTPLLLALPLFTVAGFLPASRRRFL